MKQLTATACTLLFALTGFTAATAPAFAAEADDIQALREQISQLDQKLKILERKQELKDEAAATAAKAAPKITVTDKVISIASGDGANFLKFHALVQADVRWFFNQSGALTANDAFLVRRARIFLDGQFNTNTTFLVIPDFAGSAPTLIDAYVNQAFTSQFQLRAGRFREPVGLEQLQSDSVSYFTERSFVSQIVPNRDIGLQLGGDLFNGTLNYAVGVFDGVPDGQNNGGVAGTVTNTDADNNKDVAVRVFAQPFKNDSASALQGLGFGVGATDGRQLPASGLAGYKTEAQQSVFAYRAGSIIQGKTTRISPQAYYYYGPFGFLGEYALSAIHARPGATGNELELRNQAWQLEAGYVLTGEDASYTGVVPKTVFDWNNGTWGAFEVVTRLDVLAIDKKAFAPNPPGLSLADPLANPSRITDYGLGLNWYLSKTVRASLDLYHGTFDLPSGTTTANTTKPLLRNSENAIVSRFQISF